MKKQLTKYSRGLISTKRDDTHFLNQYELKRKITHERGDSPSLPVQDLKQNDKLKKNTDKRKVE